MKLDEAIAKVKANEWDKTIGKEVADAYKDGRLISQSTCLHVIAVLLTQLHNGLSEHDMCRAEGLLPGGQYKS